jgi:hypothetical protein
MIRVVVALVLAFQFGQRAPLTPAQTLLEPAILKAIDEAAPDSSPATAINGSDAAAGEILLHCKANDACNVATLALTKLRRLPQPSRTIRVAAEPVASAKAVLHIGKSNTRAMQVIRSPWSAASVADEVVEVFAAERPVVTARAFENVGQPQWERLPITTIVAADGMDGDRQAAFVIAASAYFLATLPNAGSEALLSHLVVGAHARLAEDGRKAVAMMGNQQRASGEVLTMFAQAIEREQRRILSFEGFVPGPVDPILHERLGDMAKGITGVWASMALTPAPFVPAAERTRGRGGEDRRVATRVGQGPLPTPEPPTALLKFTNVGDIIFELGNLIDGKRSISDVRDILSAEFGAQSLPVISDYFDRLAKAGALTLK